MKVNGKEVEIATVTGKTIAEYLSSIKINLNTVAIEWNGEILEREKWKETFLRDSDRIEIIKFVGGG